MLNQQKIEDLMNVSVAGSIVSYGATNVSFEAGHIPIEGEFDQNGKPAVKFLEYIVIGHGAGEQCRRIVKPSDRQDYKEAYDAFVRGEQIQQNGTNISEIPGMSSRDVGQLMSIGINTAEQLRDANGEALEQLGINGRAMRERAVLYLDKSEEGAEQIRIAAEKVQAEKKAEDLQAQLNAMMADMAELKAANKILTEMSEDDEETEKPKRSGKGGKGRATSRPIPEDDGLPGVDELEGDAMSEGSGDGGGGDSIEKLLSEKAGG